MITLADQRLRIETPEGIAFSLPLAGPVARFLAWLFDSALVVGAATAIAKVVNMVPLLSQDWAGALYTITFFVLLLGYSVFFEWRWNGQTPGKRLLRLRVMDAQALRLDLSQVIIRNVLRAVDMLPLLYLTGGAATLLTRRAQRLGDLAANTVVVRQQETELAGVEQLVARKYNSLAEHGHLAARLRNRIPPDLAALAIRAIMLRDGLEPQARVALFAELAERMRSLVKFPDEVTADLTDEQYVRNAIEIAVIAKRHKASPAAARS